MTVNNIPNRVWVWGEPGRECWWETSGDFKSHNNSAYVGEYALVSSRLPDGI